MRGRQTDDGETGLRLLRLFDYRCITCFWYSTWGRRIFVEVVPGPSNATPTLGVIRWQNERGDPQPPSHTRSEATLAVPERIREPPFLRWMCLTQRGAR